MADIHHYFTAETHVSQAWFLPGSFILNTRIAFLPLTRHLATGMLHKRWAEMLKRVHANVEHQPLACLNVNSSSVHYTSLVYRRQRHEDYKLQLRSAAMDPCAFNNTSFRLCCWTTKQPPGLDGSPDTGGCSHYLPRQPCCTMERRQPHNTKAFLQSRQHAHHKVYRQHSSYHSS